MFKVYLAGSMAGLTFGQVVASFQDRKNALTPKFQVLTPLTAKAIGVGVNEVISSQGYKEVELNDQAITLRDNWMVDQCDILVADFTLGHDKVSIGTCCEIARAYAKDKHIVTVLPKGNIHEHAFINTMSHVIFETIEEAEEYLWKL